MAEQRVGILTGEGDYVAIRDAYDTGPGDRKIQRMDFSSDHLPTTYNSSQNRSAVSSADAADVTALSSTAITVGDKNSLVISCEFSVAGAYCIVVPVFYDSDGVVMFIGDELSFIASTLRRGASGDYMSSAKLVDTTGATSIRLLVKTISAGNVDVYAGVI